MQISLQFDEFLNKKFQISNFTKNSHLKLVGTPCSKKGVLLGLCKLQILNGFLIKCQILVQLILELSELTQIELGEVKGLTIWFAGRGGGHGE